MIPIYVKTVYSFLSSTITIDSLIQFAKEKHFSSLCICDDNMYGVMEFIKKCESNDIKPIIGLDLGFCLLYAKNYQGYVHLLKISSLKSTREITLDDLKKYSSDLVCFVNFAEEKKDELISLFTDYYIYGDDLPIRKTLCLQKDDLKTLKYLMMLRDGKTFSDDYDFDDNVYYLSYQNEKINEFLNKCHFSLPKYSLSLPDYSHFFDLKGMNSNEYLRNLSIAGLTKRLNNKVTLKYKDRLLYELDIIEKMGYANYFLIVYDFVKYAKNHHILVGPGRGSAAGSLVSFSIGIIEVDPIKYDLLFERFLNPSRVTLPDIDIDFPDDKRDEIISYVKSIYGEKCVSQVISFDTFGSRMAIRDMGRIMNIPLYMIDDLCKKIGERSLKESENDSKVMELIQSDNKLTELFLVAKKIEGLPRHSSVHASGVLISNKELDEIVPLVFNNYNYICGYEKDYLEELGLLKFDFLSLKNLTTITRILSLIKENKGEEINFNQIPLNDKKTFELFSNGDTLGVFQFEKDGMRNFLRKLKPETFEDIYNANAFYRPGPSDSIPLYLKRRLSKEKVLFDDERLSSILNSTMGIMVYQEQIMLIASEMASFTMGEADNLRRAIAKKKREDILKLQDKFFQGALQKGYKEDIIKKVFSDILQFAGYGFNKSHSVAYSLISYKIAYLKANYPLYFYLAILEERDEKKFLSYLKEMKRKNIKIFKPDINKSNKNYMLYYGGILLPLNIIKGINNLLVNKIVEARANGFMDIYDFFAKIVPIDKASLLKLIYSGSLDSFGYNRKTLCENLDILVNYGTLVKDLGSENVLKPELNLVEEFTKNELISFEKDNFGFYLSNHPVTYYREKLNNKCSILDLKKYFNQRISCVLMIDYKKELTTKKGERMAFLTCSDEESIVSVVIFPKVFEKIEKLEKNAIIKVEGRVIRKEDYEIVADNIINIKEIV